MTTGPTISIIVTPRERFGLAEESLRSLLTATPEEHELIYVDAGSPPALASRLRSLAREHRFTLLQTRDRITPNRARNVGLAQATGSYVVFVDNDVEFSQGWLTAMLDCAEQAGAWAVGPLYLEGKLSASGDYSDNFVHMAGGDMKFSGEWGSRAFAQTQWHFRKRLGELTEAELTRQACDIIEFHCALIRRDVFDKVGTMDEKLLTTREHLDFCQRILDAGGSVYFEPSSIISYHTPPPVHLRDLPYFMLRWSDRWTRWTLDHFATKYGLADSYRERVGKHRWIRQWVVTESLAGGKSYRPLVARLVKVVDPVVNKVIVAFMGRRPNGSTEIVIRAGKDVTNDSGS